MRLHSGVSSAIWSRAILSLFLLNFCLTSAVVLAGNSTDKIEPCRVELSLPEKYGYKWYPITDLERVEGTSVSFTIDAERDAIIGVSGSVDGSKPSYEITIGANRNGWLTIDREPKNPRSRVLRVNAAGALRPGTSEVFYINYLEGTITIGQGNVVHNRVLAQYKDPNPQFEVWNSVGISMFGHPGQWKVFCQIKARCSEGVSWSDTGGAPCAPCKVCDADKPIIEKCTPASDTVCTASCIANKTWSESGIAPCIKCAKCPGGQAPIEACTPTSKTVCPGPCENGRSWSPSGMQPCKWCGTCVPGSPIYQPCSVKSDIQCYPFGRESGHMNLPRHRIPCKPGTWSSRGFEPCRPCSHCKEGEKQLESCNVNHDIRCESSEFSEQLKVAAEKVSQVPGIPTDSSSSSVLSP